jgi:hypothetical protein
MLLLSGVPITLFKSKSLLLQPTAARVIAHMSSIIESIASDARPPQRAESILETIGKTPLVKLSNKMAPEGVNVYVKCEAFNPMGSVKDRLALGCIEVRLAALC